MTQYVWKFYTFFHKKDCAPYSNALWRMEIKFWPSRYFNIWTSTGRMATKLGGYKHHLTWTYFTHFDRWEWCHRVVIMIFQYLEQIAVNKLFSKMLQLVCYRFKFGCVWVHVTTFLMGKGRCGFFAGGCGRLWFLWVRADGYDFFRVCESGCNPFL